jgi:hypothetical protein
MISGCLLPTVPETLINSIFQDGIKKAGYHIRPIFNLSLKASMSAATFKSAIRHVRAVAAVCPDYTATPVYDMETARFGCRLIVFFLFIFLVHVFISLFA